MKFPQSVIRSCFGKNSLLFLLLLLIPLNIFAGSSNYESGLIKTALDRKLFDERYWRVLLDYEPALFSGWESRIDFPGSFMAPDGKTNPKNELTATISSFFLPESFRLDVTNQHPKCQFIARYTWLKEKLNFDESKLPDVKCTDYQNWRKNLDIDRITMVFPSSDIKIPASMFGHTLFRVDSTKREASNLLNYSVNFAANVNFEETNVFTYSILGIFGGFDGVFSMYQYHMKVQEYNEIEQRDMWEYELAFTESEINRFMLRLWELRFTTYDYFFFRENCSFMLLSLIEAAKPEMKLTEKFFLWTVPVDTVRLLEEYPGLIKRVNYRPSRLNRAFSKIPDLTSEELKLFDDIKTDLKILEDGRYEKLSPQKKAQILDLLSDYYLIQDKPENKGDWRKLLAKRALIPVQSFDEPVQIKPELNPLNIHKTSKILLGAGANRSDRFLQFVYRPAYHDYLDSTLGFGEINFYRIDFFKLTARIYEKSKANLDEFKFLGLGNISPMNRMKLFYTYNLDVKIISAKHEACDTCLIQVFNGDFGFTKKIGILNFLLTFGGELKEKIHTDFSYQRIIYGKTGIYSFGSSWNTNVEYYLKKDTDKGKRPAGTIMAGVSFHRLKDADIRLTYENTDQYSEVVLSAGKYF